MAALQLSPKPTARRASHWFEKIMAAIALLNLLLVIFDLSYVPCRDFYVSNPLLPQFATQFTDWYDHNIKGIEPNRVTVAYLEAVKALQNEVIEEGLSSPEVEALLAELRTRSAAMIDEDPFEIANKSGTLERIKERLLNHVEDTTGEELESSKQAFATFWSQQYLAQENYDEAITFFEEEISPLIETNYYRRIGFDGRPLNRFMLIDMGFISLFGLEFLLRTWYLSRRYPETSWLDAMLWRWYDVFLLIPFSLFAPFWALLRAIPVTIRINQSHLINLEPLYNRIIRGVIANFAVELTEIVVIRVIEQLQKLIRQGDIARALLRPESGPKYIDLNDIDEIKTISQRLQSTLVHQVLPKVRPDIEALLHHAIASALQNLPVYQGLQRVPGLNSLPDQLTKQLAAEIYENIYGTIASSLNDQVGTELAQRLVQNLIGTFRSEIQKEHAIEELESLVNVWLDEVKVNYVKRLAEEDIERLREQTQRLYALTQINKK